MKKMFVFFLVLYAAQLKAQLTPEQRIQDSVIGWWSDNYWDRNWKTPAGAEGRLIETHVTKMVEWMKKSYTPVGGLGTVTRYTAAGGFGVKFMVWNVSHDKQWTEPNGKFKPISEENTKFYISANKIFGAYPVSFVNKEGQYLFTWQPDGYNPVGKTPGEDKRPAGIHPNAAKYITVRNEMQSVMLAPDNKLPFTPVTKGAFLQLADEALAGKFATANEFDKKAIDRIRKNIAQLKEKYKNSLQEDALLKDMQPSMYSFDYSDPFQLSQNDISWKRYYPLYKLTGSVLEKLKLPQPQWITVSLPYETRESGNQLYEMYTAITEHINYDYIYNYFFNPDKVKGIAYTPSNEAALNARLDAYRKKNRSGNTAVLNTNNWPAGAFFFDDFSSGNEGGDPANWFFRKFGKHAVVTAVKNEPGKWLQLGYNTPVNPALLKKPFPENFTLEYDMVTDGGFTSRTGGAALLTLNTRTATSDGTERDGGDGSKISIEIISGNERDYNNNNYMGMLRVRLSSVPELNKQNYADGLVYEYALREFTNNKTKIHVAVTLKNNILSVHINNKQVAISTGFKMTYGASCISCGVPAGSRFNTVFWKNTTNDADAVKVYISNIKITKE